MKKGPFEAVKLVRDTRDKDGNGCIFLVMITDKECDSPCKLIKVKSSNSDNSVTFTYKTVTPRAPGRFRNCFYIEEKLVLVTQDNVTFFDLKFNQLNQVETEQIHKDSFTGIQYSLPNEDNNSLLFSMMMNPVSSVFDWIVTNC